MAFLTISIAQGNTKGPIIFSVTTNSFMSLPDPVSTLRIINVRVLIIKNYQYLKGYIVDDIQGWHFLGS